MLPLTPPPALCPAVAATLIPPPLVPATSVSMARAAPTPVARLGVPGALPGAPFMVITDGSNRTGGNSARRERRLRRDGSPPTPLPTFTEAERLQRVAARAATLLARRTLRRDKLALHRILVLLTAEVTPILHEVHGLGWSPSRWFHLIFPNPSAYDPTNPDASYVIGATVTFFVQYAPPLWREILSRIVGYAESSPLGLQACFSPTLLLALDGFLSCFSDAKFRSDWLPGILRRLRLLRLPPHPDPPLSDSPPVPPSNTSKPSKNLRALRRSGVPTPTLGYPCVPVPSPPPPLVAVPELTTEPPLVRVATPLPSTSPLPPVTQGLRNSRYLQARHDRAFGFARGLAAKF